MNIKHDIKDNISFITFDQQDSAANVLSTPFLTEFKGVLEDVAKQNPKAVILQSAKKNIFIAGASLEEIKSFTHPALAKEKAQAGQEIMNMIEDLKAPTIAVVNGAALGGGCELAIACDYRIALSNGKVKIGLPEVNLGFVPGFGGTVRLPKLVGFAQGLEMILACKMLDEQKGFKAGIFDAVIPETLIERELNGFIDEVVAGKRKPRIKQKNRGKGVIGLLEGSGFGRGIILSQAHKGVMSKTRGVYPAPLKAIDVIKVHYGKSRVKAMDIEASAFGELAVGGISKNLVHVFFLTEQCRKLSVGEGAPKRIEKCGVIGAGIMGGGVAQLLSQKNVWVRLKDLDYKAIALGLQSASKVFYGALKRRKISKADMSTMMARISGSTDYKGFHNVDMVIEAVVENMDVKKKVLAELEDVVSSDAILATNTSSLSVQEMATAVKDPSRVVGFHFFNPVHRMPLLEIIQTPQTSAKTLATAVDFAKKLGKMPILVQDGPGFLVNRVLLAYINEAGRLYEEGYDINIVDKSMVGFGMPMGPFTLADEVGLDVGVKVLKILEEGLGERFKPVEVFDAIMNAKLLGKKSGKGFYVHGKRRAVNAELESLAKPHRPGKVNYNEAVNRMVCIMINEAASCLQDGIVADAGSVDAGMILGTGFPPFRGGLLKYADDMGIEQLITDLDNLERVYQDGRFVPSPYILALKEKQSQFYS